MNAEPFPYTSGPWLSVDTFSSRKQEVKHDKSPWIQHAICKNNPNGDLTKIIALEEVRCRPSHCREAAANARLIAAAPDRHEQLLAILVHGWKVVKIALYDEGRVDGWRWIEPDGTAHDEIGDWSELPPWPASARAAIDKLEGRTSP